MHNADWDGIKAIPLALIAAGILMISINFPLFGGIVVGTIALAFLGKWLKDRWTINRWTKTKRKRHENTPSTDEVERVPSYTFNNIPLGQSEPYTIKELPNDTNSDNV